MTPAETTPQACPMPTPHRDEDERAAITAMLAVSRIVIVGLSNNPARPSFGIGQYLQSMGKKIVPVNPNCDSVLGEKSYASIKDVPGEIEVVNVFRRPEYCAQIARDAIAASAKGIWLQSGIANAEAQKLAREAGIHYIQNRCIMIEHMRRK